MNVIINCGKFKRQDGEDRILYLFMCNYRPLLKDSGKMRNLRIVDKCEHSEDMPRIQVQFIHIISFCRDILTDT
jgi:hypothetical protein